MMRAFIGLAAAALLSGCLPLTFANDPAIDFDRYPSVYIQPIVTSGSPLDTGYSTGLQRYLADELRVNSGFRFVTTDPRADYVAVLVVEMVIDEDYDYNDDDYDYTVDAQWYLRTVGGEGIDTGRVSEDANSREEASEEAMDYIAYRYLAAYRL